MPRVELATGVPRVAKMSTPSCLRSRPRGAPKVSATWSAATPCTGIATATGGGMRESSHCARVLAMNGWSQAQYATAASAARTNSQATSRASRRTSAGTSGAFELVLQALAQVFVEPELARELVEVGALHEVLLVDRHQAGQVHLRSDLRRRRRARHLGRVERLGEFGVQPLLHFAAVVRARELALDHPALALVDVAVGLRRAHQRAQDRLAVQRRLRRRKPVDGLRRSGLRIALLRFVVAVGLVGHHADRGQAAIGRKLARGFVLAQQQAKPATGDRALAEVGIEQAAASRWLCARRLGGGLGLQEMVEEALQVHACALWCGEEPGCGREDARRRVAKTWPLPGNDSGRRLPSRAGGALARCDQAAASFSFFSGRTLTFTEAGLAANHCSSLVNGLMPLRFGLAGTLTEVIFSRPGRVKLPMPFLLTEPCTAPSSEARTARTSLAARPVPSTMCATRPDLVRASLIGFGAAGLAAATFFGAAFLTALVAFFAMFM